MEPVASQLIEDVTAHAQSDSLEDAREICADDTYSPNNLVFYYDICRREISQIHFLLHLLFNVPTLNCNKWKLEFKIAVIMKNTALCDVMLCILVEYADVSTCCLLQCTFYVDDGSIVV